MALDFPNSPPPQSGDSYVAPNGQLYVYDGEKWIGSEVAQAAYTLPTASTTVLGGVKIDGTTITITDGVISGGIPGPKGDTGDTGLNSEFIGTFNTAGDLTSAFPTPPDNYWAFVKDADPLKLNIARPDTTGWVSESITLVQGPKGDSGDTGPKGDTGDIGNTGPTAYQQGTPFVWTNLSAYNPNDVVSYGGSFWILSDPSGYLQSPTPDAGYGWTEFNLLIPGPKGDTGNNGADGADGLSAYEVAVANGFVGGEEAWLSSLVGTAGADGADGADGLSAYEVAVSNGFVGSEAQWLTSLVGTAGTNGADGTSVSIIGSVANVHSIPPDDPQVVLDTAFPSAVIGNGVIAQDDGHLWVYDGTMWDDVGNIVGPAGANGTNGTNGASAYELAVANGFVGTEAQWLTSLIGADGADGTNGTNGASAYELAVANGFVGTEAQWLTSLIGSTGPKGDPGATSYIENPFTFSVAGDDSTQRTISNGELIKFIGSSGVSVSSDSEGYITIAGPNLSGYLTSVALSNLTDVALVGTPSNGQVLKYDSSTSKWYNGSDQTGGSGGGLSYTDFSVGVPNAASGSGAISYNNTNGVFKYTPPDLSSYLTSITSLQVTTALGYTPYSSSNPNGYTSNTGTVTSIATSGSVNGITLTGGTITSSGTITLGGSLSGIANNQLTNSSVTVNGTSISLGGSGTITATATNALTIGTGLGGTSYNGSTAVTITNTDTGSAQNIFKTVAVSGQTSVTAASNTATLTLVAGTGITLTTDNTAKSVTVTAGGGSPTFTNVTVSGQFIEPYQTYSTAISGSPNITFNCTGGNIWLVNPSGGPASAWTALFTNVQVTTNQATNITMIIVEGSTPFIPSAVSINGTAVSVTWQGGTAPTPTASKTEAVGYSVLQTGASTYTVLGQMVTFG